MEQRLFNKGQRAVLCWDAISDWLRIEYPRGFIDFVFLQAPTL